MKLTCSNCQQQVHLDDTKVPSGVFKVKCPKCGKVIAAQKDSDATVVQPSAVSVAQTDKGDGEDSVSPAIREYIKKEVASAKREILEAMKSLFRGEFRWHGDEEEEDAPGARHALICEDEPMFVEMISVALKRLGYHCDVARSTAEALKKLEGRSYDLVTVDYVFPDDKEGGQKILSKINGIKPAIRRQMFVVLISANIKSADASAAFFHGANIGVNKEEIKNLEAYIREGQRRFQEIYRVFNQLIVEKSNQL